MQYIDTHSHLYLEEFDNDRDEVISRAVTAGVRTIMLPNIDNNSIAGMMDMVAKYPGICYPMIGVHPTSVKDDYLQQLESVKEWITKGGFVAVGEIGIDLYWDKTFIREQEEIFRAQLDLALDNKLPAVIHCRDSFLEIFRVLDDYRDSGIRGIFHAFTGDTGEAEKVIEAGFLLGIGGIVTFKNSGLDRVVADIGIDNLVLETDSPYLAPEPVRGKRNESSYIPHIAARVAAITGIDAGEVARVTTGNAMSIFNLEN